MKVNIETLKGMNYDEGVKLLEENGYYENGSGAPDGEEDRALKAGDNFWTDIYYTLEDEDGNEHTVSFEQEWEKGESAEEDKLIREFWEDLQA